MHWIQNADLAQHEALNSWLDCFFHVRFHLRISLDYEKHILILKKKNDCSCSVIVCLKYYIFEGSFVNFSHENVWWFREIEQQAFQ